MSGQQFLETLRQIGYPKADSLSARSFDWIFEDEAALPFLSWFCNTVGHENVLSKEEKETFAELEQSDEVLEGHLLKDALECMPSHQVTVSKEDTEELREDLHRLELRKERLINTRNTLRLHHTGLSHRLSKFSDVEAKKKRDERHALEKCHRVEAESGACLQRLGESVQRLCHLYHDKVQSDQAVPQDSDCVFLSQIQLEPFFKAEEAYSKELTHFTKKLFFEGIADIVGGELSRYQLLEVAQPIAQLVHGPSQKTFVQDCEELSRLQTIFPKSEAERINALVEWKCAESVGQAADDILKIVLNGQFPTDIQDISRQAQDVKSSLAAVSAELRQVTEEEVKPLVSELGKLHVTKVLTGDYRLKMARQNYFKVNQDQVIKYLVQQRARNEFLTMAYEVESRNHRDVHRLLTAVRQTLQDNLSQRQARLQAMEDPALTKDRYKRGTIDTRDTATTRLHQMLVPVDESSSQRPLFLTYSSIVQGAQMLKEGNATAKAQARSAADRYENKVHNLEMEVERCHEVIYSESSTVGGQPMLMPRDLLDSTSQLDNMLHKLEAAILSIVTDVNNKKKELKKDALQTKQRELFIYFHNHPERLQQTVENLEKRLQAHEVQ